MSRSCFGAWRWCVRENDHGRKEPGGPKSKRVALNWPKRVAICMGTASGLAFLHEEAEPQVIHRDIKASNVLLDGDFHPKIGDFGLAKLFPDNVTHISTRVAGTVGYLAPEYAMLGQLTKKADVYSFGVLILEIISGRSSSNAAFGDELLVLVEWAWKLREEGRLLDIVDPELTDWREKEVVRFIKVALLCTQAGANKRPNMKQVLKMLSKEVSLNEEALTDHPVVYQYQVRSSSLHEASLLQVIKDKPVTSQFDTSTHQSLTQMLPR